MSFAGVNPSATTPGIYRLVSGGVTTGITNANVNDNVSFVTNIPSLDFALRIWRTRWWNTFSAFSETLGATNSIQLFAQLTENQSKTAVLAADSSYLDEFVYETNTFQSTAAGGGILPTGEVIHDFNPVTTPYTVATKLNLVLSKIVGSFQAAGTTWKPVVTIEYTLERLTADLRDYLAKRLQIQGS